MEEKKIKRMKMFSLLLLLLLAILGVILFQEPSVCAGSNLPWPVFC